MRSNLNKAINNELASQLSDSTDSTVTYHLEYFQLYNKKWKVIRSTLARSNIINIRTKRLSACITWTNTITIVTLINGSNYQIPNKRYFYDFSSCSVIIITYTTTAHGTKLTTYPRSKVGPLPFPSLPARMDDRFEYQHRSSQFRPSNW